MRSLVSLIIDVLVIPIVSTANTSFDYYSKISYGEDELNFKTVIYLEDIILKFLTETYQIVPFLISIIMHLVLFVYWIINVLFIFNRNPKNGELFSKSNRKYKMLQLIFTLLFVLRMWLLYSRQFWRGVATIELSMVQVIIIFFYVPNYSLASNYLSAIPRLVFAGARLCSEIEYVDEDALYSFFP